MIDDDHTCEHSSMDVVYLIVGRKAGARSIASSTEAHIVYLLSNPKIDSKYRECNFKRENRIVVILLT